MDKKISYVVNIDGDFYPHYMTFKTYEEAKNYYDDEIKYLPEGYSIELHKQELIVRHAVEFE